ncbi:MAG: aromatic ring-hydroxylating dioxygenase subunit alpha [Candidatus Caenarcaniphilales bacterium]|nr:aromatic ring-hydroxylating dioxygenase subunit alpha [Candidatus Caenarcaniphilales bacterium]
MQLIQGWYAILDGKEVKEKPLGIKRLGKDLVVWRDLDSNVIIMDDRCPHRMAKLSLGEVKTYKDSSSCVVCPFHGFEFDSEGKCTFVPETKAAAPNLRVAKYFTKEAYGFIWLWWGDSEPTNSIPWFEGLSDKDFPENSYAQFEETWPVHFSRSVENQLDYAHLPFVHKNTIGSEIDPSLPREMELEADFMRVYMDKEQEKPPQKGYFEFRFPNIWQLAITEKFKIVMAFVPIDEGHTKLYQRNYRLF